MTLIRHDAFTRHVAAPAGEWINDPNGLVYADGRYHLFMQHSATAPDFKEIGWARASSTNLVEWTWHGTAIPHGDGISAYSGSVVAAAPFEAFLTRHNAALTPPVQRQWRATSRDGVHWAFDDKPVGPAGKNVRDPFVFFFNKTGDWRMLVAQPCDWHGWQEDAPSTIAVWRSADRHLWEPAGTIGPWAQPGVMWEVPVLLDFDDRQVLIVSTIDRFDGSSRCGVRVWNGSFNGAQFVPEDAKGTLLDMGPDFYALCVNTVDGWPDGSRVALAWASNWRTARDTRWPGGTNGGPITSPRVLTLEADVLCQRIASAAETQRVASWLFDGTSMSWAFVGVSGRIDIGVAADGTLTASRRCEDTLSAWDLGEAVTLAAGSRIDVYLDAGLIELSFPQMGRVLTIYLDGATLC